MRCTGQSFLYVDMKNNYKKPYRTIPEQIEILKSRGMTISDEESASGYLSTIGYYRLSGYWFPMRLRDKKIKAVALDQFKDGTDFHQAVELYVFDRKLRLHFIDALERIEVALRVEIATQIGKRDPWVHRKPLFLHSNFAKKKTRTGQTLHEIWLEKLDKATLRSKEHFVQKFRKKYTEPLPIWVAIEVWDFGQLSFFLSGMQYDDRVKFAEQYGLGEDVLRSWVRALNFVRNLCAHHARVWNMATTDQPKELKAGQQTELDHIIGDVKAQTRIYGHAVMVQYLLQKINPTSNWGERTKELVASLPDAPGVNIKDMGFPENWESLDLWKS